MARSSAARTMEPTSVPSSRYAMRKHTPRFLAFAILPDQEENSESTNPSQIDTQGQSKQSWHLRPSTSNFSSSTLTSGRASPATSPSSPGDTFSNRTVKASDQSFDGSQASRTGAESEYTSSLDSKAETQSCCTCVEMEDVVIVVTESSPSRPIEYTITTQKSGANSGGSWWSSLPAFKQISGRSSKQISDEMH